ncbi:MAG: hypothetical protein IJM21_05835 [Clostridia bacterium]|nr:hypothetical protein [Clostridia bacterium]
MDKLDKREKTAKIVRWIAFAAVLLIILSGLATELLLKVHTALKTVGSTSGFPPAKTAEIVWNRILFMFGTEAQYFWAFCIFVLNLMRMRPENAANLIYVLRWLPYLILFLLPAVAAALKKFKQIPLLIVGGFALLEGCGLLITSFTVKIGLTWGMAIPFIVEALLLILLSVALWTKNTPFVIIVGVLCVLFMLISPLVTLATGIQTVTLNAHYPLRYFISMIFRGFPNLYAVSPWPIFKGFSLAGCALIAFTAPAGFLKPLEKK